MSHHELDAQGTAWVDPQPSPAASRLAAPPWAAGGGGSGDRCMGAWCGTCEGFGPVHRFSSLSGSSHGPGEPLTQHCPHHHSRARADTAPAAPWHGRCGGAWGRCSSPFTHGLFRSLLPGPPGARARLSRQQQSLVRAPRHGPHRPPRPAGAEAPPDAPAHRPLGGPQAAGSAGGHGVGAVRRHRRSWWGPWRGPRFSTDVRHGDRGRCCARAASVERAGKPDRVGRWLPPVGA